MKCCLVISEYLFAFFYTKAAKIVKASTILCVIMVISSCTSSNLADGIRDTPNTDSIESQIQYTSKINETNQLASLPINDSLINSLDSPPSFEFLNIVGPPQNIVSLLNREVRKSAKHNGINLLNNGENSAAYQIKGFLTAIDNGSGSVLVFAWEILDRSGNMLHKISGEEYSASRATDPWRSINSQMVNNVVGRTMRDLKSWIDTSML